MTRRAFIALTFALVACGLPQDAGAPTIHPDELPTMRNMYPWRCTCYRPAHYNGIDGRQRCAWCGKRTMIHER